MWFQANTQELGKDKWLCPLSGKKFKGPDFVRKHIFNKHGEKVDEVKKEVQYYNNYLKDPKRPQLPENPKNGADKAGRGGRDGGSRSGKLKKNSIFFCLKQKIVKCSKVEKILKGSLVMIQSPSVKIQIMGRKVCLRCKGKTLLGVVNKLLNTKSLLTSPSNVLAYYLKETFPPIIWIFMKVKVMGSAPGYLLQSSLP